MPGMNSTLSPASPILTSAFRSALLHQALIISLIFVLLFIAWGMTRTAFFGPTTETPAADAALTWREPRARTLLRVGFGIIWLFDGLLQAQPQMAGGLADQVVQPSASGSPGWVQSLVNFGVNSWDYHPIQAAAAAVWIQAGIGLWLLLAVRGRTARLAGLASVGWGLVVWVFGESFGGIFAPGLTVLFGAPGAALIYVVAGALLALPQRTWDDPRRIGRLLLGGMGVFFLGMALLQAWPGRGFWQGGTSAHPGSLSGMIASMVSTPQPHPIYALVAGFGNFTLSHGLLVNLITVIALVFLGGGLLAAAARADARLAKIVVIFGAVFCLADWLLVEDLGFFGGLGTDPNSMVPFIVLFTAGYLALAPAPADAVAQVRTSRLAGVLAGAAASPATAVEVPVMLAAPIPEESESPAPAAGENTRQDIGDNTGDATAESPEQTTQETADKAELDEGAAEPTSAAEPIADAGEPAAEPESAPAPEPAHVPAQRGDGRARELLRAFAGTPLRVVVGLGALGIALVGAVPMAAASVNRTADPITAEAIAGSVGQADSPAANFTLTGQDGNQVSLASLRGKVVLLTFLDPVCTTDCPLIAQEMKSADAQLGSKASDTELVAVVANPTYLSVAYTKAFTEQEGFSQTPNWLYLTGSLKQLSQVWNAYGVEVEDLPAGAMAAHDDIMDVIDAQGNLREQISDDPGPGTNASESSFSVLFHNSVLQAMGQPS
jgi:cytochrome oxidase Cu insertion factor (SCO1/SenC/PrrC family)